jgi:hypothetical protein
MAFRKIFDIPSPAVHDWVEMLIEYDFPILGILP